MLLTDCVVFFCFLHKLFSPVTFYSSGFFPTLTPRADPVDQVLHRVRLVGVQEALQDRVRGRMATDPLGSLDAGKRAAQRQRGNPDVDVS